MINHSIIIREKNIDITIFDPGDGFGQIRYVNGDNVEHIFTIKSVLPKQIGTDLEVQYSKEIGLIGRNDLRNSYSSRYLDSMALTLLESFQMQAGGTQSPRVWMIKHMMNGLISRLAEFDGSEINRRGIGHEPFLLDGTAVQPVVLDEAAVGGSDPNFTIDANVVNIAAGTTNYTLRDDQENVVDQNTTGSFTGISQGVYTLEVLASDGAQRIQTITISA